MVQGASSSVQIYRLISMLCSRHSCSLSQLTKQMLLLFTPLFGVCACAAHSTLVVGFRTASCTTDVLRQHLLMISLILSDFVVLSLFLLKAVHLFFVAII
jgi:hypothetical protein